MNNQLHTTLRDRDGPPTYRRTATAIGVIYLLGMVVGIGGLMLASRPAAGSGGRRR